MPDTPRAKLDRETFMAEAVLVMLQQGLTPSTAKESAQYLAKAVYDDHSPPGEWKRGWVHKRTGTMVRHADYLGIVPGDGDWSPIVYRVVGEQAAGRDERGWGIQNRLDGSVINYSGEAAARRAATDNWQLVRLTVEPVEEVS